MPDDSNKVETNSSTAAAPKPAADAPKATGESAAAPQPNTGAESTPAKPGDKTAKKDNEKTPVEDRLGALKPPSEEENKNKKSLDKDFPEVDMMLEIREKVTAFNSKVYAAVYNIAKYPVTKAADAIQETIKKATAGDNDFAKKDDTPASDNKITDTSKTGIIEQREGYDQEVKEEKLGIDVDGDDAEDTAEVDEVPEMSALGDTVTNPQDAANSDDFTTSYKDYDDVANASRAKPGAYANEQDLDADNTTTMNPN